MLDDRDRRRKATTATFRRGSKPHAIRAGMADSGRHAFRSCAGAVFFARLGAFLLDVGVIVVAIRIDGSHVLRRLQSRPVRSQPRDHVEQRRAARVVISRLAWMGLSATISIVVSMAWKEDHRQDGCLACASSVSISGRSTYRRALLRWLGTGRAWAAPHWDWLSWDFVAARKTRLARFPRSHLGDSGVNFVRMQSS